MRESHDGPELNSQSIGLVNLSWDVVLVNKGKRKSSGLCVLTIGKSSGFLMILPFGFSFMII